MINLKQRNSDSAYLICLAKFIKTVYFLINTVDKEIYNIFNCFPIPLLLYYILRILSFGLLKKIFVTFLNQIFWANFQLHYLHLKVHGST